MRYMSTYILSESAHTAAAPHAVFRLLMDVSTWSQWGDWHTSELEQPGSPDPDGVGAIRRFSRPRVTREQVVAVDPDRSFSYVLLSGIPIKDYQATVTLEPTADGGTTIRWQSSYRALPGLGRYLQKVLSAFLADTAQRLGRAALTADPVTDASSS
jgi:hypothetical protein